MSELKEKVKSSSKNNLKHSVVGNRILLELDKIDPRNQKIGSGLLVASENSLEFASTTRTKAKVVDIGPGAYKDSTPWCKIGDTVHFARYGAVVLESEKEDKKEYWVIRDIDVLTVEK